MLCCPCVVQKATTHVQTKALNICHQAQKGFCNIFVGIPQYQKRYLVYVLGTSNVIYSYDVVFDEKISSTLAYTSQPYAEVMAMCSAVLYTPYDISSREQTGDIITFSQFKEGFYYIKDIIYYLKLIIIRKTDN